MVIMPQSDDALASRLKAAVESVVRDGKPMSHVTRLLNKLRLNHGLQPIPTPTSSQRLAKAVMSAISFIDNHKSKFARIAIFLASVALLTLVEIDKNVRDSRRMRRAIEEHARYTKKNTRRNNEGADMHHTFESRYMTGKKRRRLMDYLTVN